MTRFVIGIAPAVLVTFGLYVGHSVVLTIVLFLGWLGIVPPLDELVMRKQSLTRVFGSWGLRVDTRQTLLGLSLGIVILGTLLIGAYLLNGMLFDIERLKSLLETWHFSGDHKVLLLILLVLLNPILEEVYWRGYLYGKFSQFSSPGKSLLLSSLWFTSYHLVVIAPVFSWPYNAAAAMAIFVAGLLWGWIRQRTESVIAPMISHMCADLAIVIIYAEYVV